MLLLVLLLYLRYSTCTTTCTTALLIQLLHWYYYSHCCLGYILGYCLCYPTIIITQVIDISIRKAQENCNNCYQYSVLYHTKKKNFLPQLL
jgi:hypothetical protein